MTMHLVFPLKGTCSHTLSLRRKDSIMQKDSPQWSNNLSWMNLTSCLRWRFAAFVIKTNPYCLNRRTTLRYTHHNDSFKYHICFGKTCSAACAAENVHIVKKNPPYTHIYYTMEMHLYADFPHLILSSPLTLLLSLMWEAGSPGHPAMPHQYACWWNAFPCFRPCDSRRSTDTGYGRSR